ncbi:MAG TPA: class I SAM-dependent methyltransferase [Flavobacterium sp.]|jgi:2-polyprenyl-3-methyl-5-hydroxy-6-metoxy-1,4-benzoquinol methylase
MPIPNAQPFLIVVDHSVTKETFELHHNVELDMLITKPRPEDNELHRYYESEEYISHTDSKRSLFDRIYQQVRIIALRSKLHIISKHHKLKGNLLDIGAGTGDFLVAAKAKGWLTVGFEPSSRARTIAINKGVELVEATESISAKSIDVITMWHVLEHVPDPRKQLAELKRILKEDGTIFIAVPNFKSHDAQHYGKYWAAYDVPRHLYHFSKTAISKLCAEQDLEVIAVLPMLFDSFYVSLLSEKYKTGSIKYFSGFWRGLLSNVKASLKNEYSSHIYVIKTSKKQF